MSDAKTVVIGGASGAWGDSPMGVEQLVQSDARYLMMDYLAEVTMSLLAKARVKDPEAGFPPDFVGYLKPHLETIAQKGIKVVSNAGGVNPAACKRALDKLCEDLGLSLKVAVVTGDDLMPQIDSLREGGVREWISKEPLPAKLLTANAYLGALPIAEALKQGADIVITGRCVDSALGLGILIHEFGWGVHDYDLLAAGSLVGHVLECGPQATGGVFTDWQDVPSWDDIGYPIARCNADGTFVLTKMRGTGGLIDTRCVAEQVLYEVGDPRAYFLPDVVADFSQVRLEQISQDEVLLSGAIGRAPTSQYKVSATYQDGYRAVGMIVIIGVDAARKAERTAEALIDRVSKKYATRNLAGFRKTHVEVLGAESAYADRSKARASREVVLRVVVEHDDAKALDVFAREIGSIGLTCAQGTAGLIGGRPKPTPVVRLFTFFIDKNRAPAIEVVCGSDEKFEVVVPADGGYVAPMPDEKAGTLAGDVELMKPVPLLKLAHARSGDKGNSSDISIFSRKPEYLDHLRAYLTPERIADHFEGVAFGAVRRYEVPGLNALKFTIEDALGGGGMASMRIDPQGKAYGQRALEIEVPVPASWGID